jgi:hypothetical protein
LGSGDTCESLLAHDVTNTSVGAYAVLASMEGPRYLPDDSVTEEVLLKELDELLGDRLP